MKTVEFMSRFDMIRKIKANDFPEKSLIVSLNDTFPERGEIKNLSLHYTHMTVATLGYVLKDDKSVQTEELQKLFRELGYNLPEVDHVFVHCFAGVSRSAAVAKFIKDKWGYENSRLDNYNQYNLDIYTQLCKLGGVETMKSYYEGLSDEN